MLGLDRVLAFDPAHDHEFFSAVPFRAGVVSIELHPSSTAASPEPYLLRTMDLHRTAERLLHPPDGQSKRLNLRTLAVACRFRVTGSRLEQSLTYHQQARMLFPQRYRQFLRLRSPAMLKMSLQNAYPRCYVTRKILANGGFYIGPFASRKSADDLLTGLLDLFKVRRCQIRILRDPQFPGCIYSEMKMCLAPCFAGCTAEAYDEEAARLAESLATRGLSISRSLESERDAASEALEFERAAAVQKRLEKVHDAFRALPELARRVEALNAVILQRSVAENSVAVFRVREGMMLDPFSLDFGELSTKPHSAEETLRAALEGSESEPVEEAVRQSRSRDAIAGKDAPEGHASAKKDDRAKYRERLALRSPHPLLGENLALLARWYYSNPREGEILFCEKDWPYRRILRACSRVLRRESAQPPPNAPSPGVSV